MNARRKDPAEKLRHRIKKHIRPLQNEFRPPSARLRPSLAWLRRNKLKTAGILIAAFAAFTAIAFFALSKDLPPLSDLGGRKTPQSTKIYDRAGKVLLYEAHAGQKRTVIPLDEIPKYLKDATIATEDERFYREPAFDWRAIARAILVDLHLRQGSAGQGASTITQQLARNAFLSPEQTFTRKLRELILAIELNERYSKDEILALYLNQIPYGPTAYGVESASQLYFGKSAKDLTLAESAILAALPRAPSYYSPWGGHAKELAARSRYVLKRMQQLGMISKDELNAALAEKVEFQPRPTVGIRAPHFVEAVQEYLAQKYGEDTVLEGGLKVTTTLDWDFQLAAEKAVADGAKRNEELYAGKNAALVAQDPKTGQILAMVGSRDYFDTANDGNFNVATQGLRQPGSALKPFAYLTLFKKGGYSPDTTLFNVPTEFVSNDPRCPAFVDFSNDNKACFHPENFSGAFTGPITLRDALAQSVNVPSVKVLYLAGMKNTLAMLQDFGVTTLTDPSRYGLSLVLGGGEVKLIDLVEAYSVLSQEGVKHQQAMVLEVRDANGNVLESFEDQQSRAADAEYPRLVNDILSDADARAPLFQASLNLTVFPGYDAALKTGTTNDYRDAWAMGYTPSLVAGVWAGNNDNRPMQKHAGSILAAIPIWHDFMAQALPKMPNETFTRPDPVPDPAKPMLNGDWGRDSGRIHSVLYYVNKSDPLGPIPGDGSTDPQFSNWESSVRQWAQAHAADLPQYSQTTIGVPQTAQAIGQTGSSQKPAVQITAPQAGSFLSGAISIQADITSGTPISIINVYFNGQAVGSFSQNFGAAYHFSWSYTPNNPDSQNLLEIEAVDANGNKGKSGVIVYH